MMIKPIISSFENANTRKICSLNIDTPLLKNLSATVKCSSYSGYQFITEIKNAYNKVLGFESFAMYQDNSTIDGLYIQVEPEYRRQYHLGEILRLISIIEMIENKIKALNIYSKNTAIFFHSKYKFEPNIKKFEERNRFLEHIASSKNGNAEAERTFAKELLQKTNQAKTSSEQIALYNPANSVIKSYIRKILSAGKEEYKKYPFPIGMDMCLTNENLIENRAYFNELFAKHNIDYQI